MNQTEHQKRAQTLDNEDPLKDWRTLFHIPEGVVYLDGNSLGLMQKSIPARIEQVANQEWSNGLIGSWMKAGWFDMPITVGNRIAPIIGVGPNQVAVSDSTSVNLYKCLAAALQLNSDRHIILAEGDNFPTDNYLAQGLAELVPHVEVKYLEQDQPLEDAVNSQVAVVMLSHVDYRSARKRDMSEINRIAHNKGALVLWDLSHTSGAVRCDLEQANSDMAVGCTYKYLNGGPGSPAFMWVAPRYIDQLKQPLSGWMGHAAPFAFNRQFEAVNGPRRLLTGTPQILSLAALDEALKIWQELDLEALYEKSRTMLDFFVEAVEDRCSEFGLELVSPRDRDQRGSHISFTLNQGGFEVIQALIARGVVGDYREPGILRFGFAPLYLRFQDVYWAVEQMADILATREWDQDKYRIRGAVT